MLVKPYKNDKQERVVFIDFDSPTVVALTAGEGIHVLQVTIPRREAVKLTAALIQSLVPAGLIGVEDAKALAALLSEVKAT